MVEASATPETAEASHLRHLLEKQPSCLLRVGRDGLLLACSDAGLSLLGKEDLAHVLDRPFDEYVAPEHLDAWREFRERVWMTGAGSVECAFASAAGTGARTLQLQAVALRNHPDGLESMLMVVRDTSTVRRLEESLVADRAAGQDASEPPRLEADRNGLRAVIEKELADQFQRTMAARDLQHNEALAKRESELTLALEGQQQLQTLLARAEAEQQRLAAEHVAELSQTERALGELTLLKNQVLKSLADQRVELEQWRETASTIEPLASMGRLANQISCELHGLIATLDERARLLLNVSRVDVSYRPAIETVHDAVLATSMARRLSSTNAEPTPDSETP
jgi:hypothetical protein